MGLRRMRRSPFCIGGLVLNRRAAHAKRQKIRHIGAEASKRPLPFGKGSRWKRTLSGKIVPQE